MVNDLVDELNAALSDRAWSMREFARRADMSHALVSQVINRTAPISADFCIKTAHALDWKPEHALRLAGILDPLPPEVPEERELLRLFRDLDPLQRAHGLENGQAELGIGLLSLPWEEINSALLRLGVRVEIEEGEITDLAFV